MKTGKKKPNEIWPGPTPGYSQERPGSHVALDRKVIVIWLVSVLRTTAIVAIYSGVAVVNVNTTSASFARVSYLYTSKILTWSTICQPGIVQTFNLIHFINLPLLICLAWVIRIATWWKIQAIAIQGNSKMFFFKSVALKLPFLYNCL